MSHDFSDLIELRVQAAMPKHAITLTRDFSLQKPIARVVMDGVDRSITFELEATRDLVEYYGIGAVDSVVNGIVYQLNQPPHTE